MNNIERKIVLNYLRRVNYKDGLFVDYPKYQIKTQKSRTI